VANYSSEQNKLWINRVAIEAPFITASTSMAFTTTIDTFVETIGVDNTGTVFYQVSTDSGTTWYYWTGAAWAITVQTNGTETSTATDINTNISTLDTDGGNFTWRAYLILNRVDKVELDQVNVTAGPFIEFSADSSDVETSGGNHPQLLVRGTVINATTVDVTDALTGSAISGTDYTAYAIPETVTIPAGVYDGTLGTAVTITGLTITNDPNVEENETIDFTLTNATGDAVLGDADLNGVIDTAQTYTIMNDEVVLVEFSADSSDVESSGGNRPQLLVIGTVTNTTTVDVTDALTGSAISGTDYTAYAIPETVTIPVGVYDGTIETAITITGLTIINDSDVEGNETIDFTLTNATGDAFIGDADSNEVIDTAQTYTITNNDAVFVEFSTDSSDVETSGGNHLQLLVLGTVINPTTVDITDALTGSAISGTDYTAYAIPETITIPAGVYDGTIETAITITGLTIINDSDVEEDETIDFTLANATGDAVLGDADSNEVIDTAQTYTITNDDVVTSNSGRGVYFSNNNKKSNLEVEESPDTSNQEWYEQYINELELTGCLEILDGNYKPSDSLTRAEGISLIVCIADLKTIILDIPVFKDVSKNYWAYDYISTAYSTLKIIGYIDKYENMSNYFGPEDLVTREQFAKILVEAFNMDFAYDCSGFTDSSEFINIWSCKYIATISSLGIVDGYPDGSFGAGINVNIAEAAKMIVNSVKVGK